MEGGQISTGSIIQWFKNNFLGQYEKEAETVKKSLYELMEEKA